MVRPELVDFVVNWMREGQSLDDIHAALASGGYAHSEINETITIASEKYTAELKELKFGKGKPGEKPEEERKPGEVEESFEAAEEREQEELPSAPPIIDEKKKKILEKLGKAERVEKQAARLEKPSETFSEESFAAPVEKPRSQREERELIAKAAAEMQRLHAEGAKHVPPKEQNIGSRDASLPEFDFKPPSNLPYLAGFAVLLLIVAGAAYFIYSSLSTPTVPSEFALVPADSNMLVFIDIKKLYSDSDVQDALAAYYDWLGSIGMPINSSAALDAQTAFQENVSKAKIVMFIDMGSFISSMNYSSKLYPSSSPDANALIRMKGVGAILFLKGKGDDFDLAKLESALSSNESVSSREYGGKKIYFLTKWPEFNYSQALENYSSAYALSTPSRNPLELYDPASFALAFLDGETLFVGTVDEAEAVIDVKNGGKPSIGSRAGFREIIQGIDSTGLFSATLDVSEDELKELESEMGVQSSAAVAPPALKFLKAGFSLDKNGENIDLKLVYFADNETIAEKSVETVTGGVRTYRGMTKEGSAVEAMLNNVKMTREGVKIKASFSTTVTQIKQAIGEYQQQQRAAVLDSIKKCNGQTSDYSRQSCYSLALYSITDKKDCELITDDVWKAKCIAKTSIKAPSDLSACDAFASSVQKDECISEGVSSILSTDWLKAKNYSYSQLSSNCGKISSKQPKEKCVLAVSKYSLNADGCKLVSNTTLKDDCYDEVAYGTKDASLCKFISSNYTRSSCEKYANYTYRLPG